MKGELKLYLIEGEYIVDMWVDMDRLHVKTNLDRIYQSTNTPIDNFDMVEMNPPHQRGFER